MEEKVIETPLPEMDSDAKTEETVSANEAVSNVEETQDVDPEVEAKAQELMELVKAYNAMKRKESNKYQVSKKENKKKKAKRRMAKKSKR